MVRLVLQGEVVVCLEALAQGFKEHATIEIQELVLTLREAEESVHTGVDLQLAVFEAAGSFHVAQADFAGHAHVAFFECGEFYAEEGPALVAHHVVDAHGGTLVVHLRDAASIKQKGIEPFVLAADGFLQSFEVGLTLVEYRRVLHEDGSRLLRADKARILRGRGLGCRFGHLFSFSGCFRHRFGSLFSFRCRFGSGLRHGGRCRLSHRSGFVLTPGKGREHRHGNYRQ